MCVKTKEHYDLYKGLPNNKTDEKCPLKCFKKEDKFINYNILRACVHVCVFQIPLWYQKASKREDRLVIWVRINYNPI